MRRTSPQLPLTPPWIAHPHAEELATMSALLDEQPVLTALVQPAPTVRMDATVVPTCTRV